MSSSVAIGPNGFNPNDAAELMRIAEFIAKSDLKPAGLKSPADCFLVMAYGMSYGFDPIMSLQMLIAVKGKVGMPGETCAALIQSHPQCRSFRMWVEGEGDDLAGCTQSWRAGRDEPNPVIRFTLKQAKQAGLVGGDSWRHYPEDMLLWKAVAREKRRNWPDVYSRIQVVEDLEGPDLDQAAPEAAGAPRRQQIAERIASKIRRGSPSARQSEIESQPADAPPPGFTQPASLDDDAVQAPEQEPATIPLELLDEVAAAARATKAPHAARRRIMETLESGFGDLTQLRGERLASAMREVSVIDLGGL